MALSRLTKLNIFLAVFNVLLITVFIVTLSSCSYSIRLANKNGTWEPVPVNNEEGYYRNKNVIVIDTVVNLKVLENEVMFVEKCPCGFYSVEYKVTMAALLKNAFTAGKKRTIKVKYVCTQEEN